MLSKARSLRFHHNIFLNIKHLAGEYSILLCLIVEVSNNSAVARWTLSVTPTFAEIRLEFVTTALLDTVSEGREFARFFFGDAFVWR